jgi:hydrogenase maturation protease
MMDGTHVESAYRHGRENGMTEHRILILGIGNLLWADEGFGVRAAEELNRLYEFGPEVTVMDGGTQGIYLLNHVCDADVLVIFDAVDFGLAPGTLHLVRDADVPRFLGAKKMSLHQTGFQEVLAMAALTGRSPRHLLLVGVQPAELEDYGGSLRPEVKAQVGPAMAAALEYLRGFGVAAKPRPPQAEAGLAPAPVGMGAYEQGRPSAAEACRVGDARFLAGAGNKSDTGN